MSRNLFCRIELCDLFKSFRVEGLSVLAQRSYSFVEANCDSLSGTELRNKSHDSNIYHAKRAESC